MEAVALPDRIHEAMVAHARSVYPEEGCGLLAVDHRGQIRMAYCLTNAARSSAAFTIDPEEHFGALSHAERHGWDIGGVFHSHPHTPAVPSRTDLTSGLDPEWIHLVVSLADPRRPEVRAWRIRRGRATELEISEVGSQTSGRPGEAGEPGH